PSISGDALTHAQLPIREGGLGLRSSYSHLGAARLASVNANRDLVNKILKATGNEEGQMIAHSNNEHPLEVFAEAIGLSPTQISEDLRNSKVQRELSTLIDSFNRTELL